MAKNTPRAARLSSSPSGNPLSGLPWWVQGIAWVGAPVAGLAWTLYFIFSIFNTQMQTMNTMLASHVSTAAVTMELIRKHLDDEVQQRWVQIGIEQRTCLNTSKSDGDRIACAGLVRGQ